MQPSPVAPVSALDSSRQTPTGVVHHREVTTVITHQVAVLTWSQPLTHVVPMQGYQVTGNDRIVVDRG
jgi:hypothetical protein